jgi:hypothetical protein
MKFYIELAISALLLLLVFDKPAYVTEMSNTMLGKTVLVIAVACVAKYRGLGAGLMASLIMLILLHDGKEGFEGKDMLKKGEKKVVKELNELKKDPEGGGAKKKPKKKSTKKEKFVTRGSDVRMTEGMMNMNSYSEGMASSMFSNGYTGNRSIINGFI